MFSSCSFGASSISVRVSTSSCGASIARANAPSSAELTIRPRPWRREIAMPSTGNHPVARQLLGELLAASATN